MYAGRVRKSQPTFSRHQLCRTRATAPAYRYFLRAVQLPNISVMSTNSGAKRRYVTTPYCQFEVQGKPSHSSATTWRRALRNDEIELDHKHVAVSVSVATDFRCVGKQWADWWALNEVQLRCSTLTPSQNYEERLLTSSRLSVCLRGTTWFPLNGFLYTSVGKNASCNNIWQ